MKASDAPLFRDADRLCTAVFHRFHDDPRALPVALCQSALALHEAVALALRDAHRTEELDRADALVLRLRLQIRLAHSLALIPDGLRLDWLVACDGIGRQLGGWMRRLGSE